MSPENFVHKELAGLPIKVSKCKKKLLQLQTLISIMHIVKVIVVCINLNISISLIMIYQIEDKSAFKLSVCPA